MLVSNLDRVARGCRLGGGVGSLLFVLRLCAARCETFPRGWRSCQGCGYLCRCPEPVQLKSDTSWRHSPVAQPPRGGRSPGTSSSASRWRGSSRRGAARIADRACDCFAHRRVSHRLRCSQRCFEARPGPLGPARHLHAPPDTRSPAAVGILELRGAGEDHVLEHELESDTPFGCDHLELVTLVKGDRDPPRWRIASASTATSAPLSLRSDSNRLLLIRLKTQMRMAMAFLIRRISPATPTTWRDANRTLGWGSSVGQRLG